MLCAYTLSWRPMRTPGISPCAVYYGVLDLGAGPWAYVGLVLHAAQEAQEAARSSNPDTWGRVGELRAREALRRGRQL